MKKLIKRLEKTAKKTDLSLRKHQVFNEEMPELEEVDYVPAMVNIQLHHAKKAGKHFDVRLILDGSDRAISFASRHGLPEVVGEPRLFVRQPDHTSEYSTWEGEISEGEYGHGRVELVASLPAIARSYGRKVDLTVTKGPYKGRYTLLQQKEKNWLAIRQKRQTPFWEERQKFKDATVDFLSSPEYVAEHKLDGVHAIATLTPKGILFAGRSKSVMGDLSEKHDHVPWIRDTKVPANYHGVVLRGELVHPSGEFSMASSALLSDPHVSVDLQKKSGKILFIPTDVVRGPYGKRTENWDYMTQRSFLEKLVGDLNHDLIRVPTAEHTDKSGFYDKIVATGGEGVVLKHIFSRTPHKLKKQTEYDLKIVGFNPGEGKYAGRGIGAFKLADRHGRIVGKVGTGLTDQMRQDAYKNPEKYLHKLVKVEVHDTTDVGSLRMPRFKGFTTDKHDPDEIIFNKSAQIPISISTVGAEKFAELPKVRQETPYYCGVAVVQAVLKMYGQDFEQDELANKLGTTEKDGTPPLNMVKLLNKLDVKAELKERIGESLKSILDDGNTVILDIQDYGNPEEKDYSHDWDNGHYVIATSHEGDNIVLEDPASDGENRRKMSYSELEKRWHDKDTKGRKYYQLGIIVSSKSKKAEQNAVAQIQTTGYDIIDKENDGENFTDDDFTKKIRKPGTKLLSRLFKK